MSNLLELAIDSVMRCESAFCRFITANDTGQNGSHQAGFYIPKCASSLLFDEAGVRGENKDKFVTICWNNAFTTESRFIYYGTGTRNEYRITRFGRDFLFFRDENIGDLLVIAREDEYKYSGFVLHGDDDIETFLAYFNISTERTNNLIRVENETQTKGYISALFNEIVEKSNDFPDTHSMSEHARTCFNKANHVGKEYINTHPDSILLSWIDAEYSLFHLFEEKFYRKVYRKPFSSCQALIDGANTILNRRKARAGKSLEHHLSALFTFANLKFEEQVRTEGNKRPDFIFPDGKSYHDFSFPADDLVFLGAKTTCKDRWRQVLNEADRIGHKYLFTLQQGISLNQINEMKDECLTLVVPEAHINSFDKRSLGNIKSLDSFIRMVHQKQN